MKTPIPGDRLAVVLLITTLLASTAGATVVLAEDTNEPNDEQDSATPIDLGQQVDAGITTGDRDWYGVDGIQRGQSVEATLSVDENASDGMYVALYDLSGDSVSGVPTYVGPGETGTASAVVERSDLYYVQVSPPPDGATGQYTLNTTTGGLC